MFVLFLRKVVGGNYRPVSLTSQICKLCESVLRDTMVEYLETNGLKCDSQHGFRRGRSCLTNLLIFLDKVTRAADERHDVDAIYLDFAKSFNKVPHQ
jgi:Reverse transcriptase (RNA-dependent DNA polymerase)